MSRIEDEAKDKRIKSSVYIVSCFMCLFLINFIFEKGIAGILQSSNIGVLIGKVLIIAMGVIALIAIFYLVRFMLKHSEESDRANRAEYLLYLISRGKDYSQIESTYTGSLGAYDKLKRDTREWLTDEGPEAFSEERNNRNVQARARQDLTAKQEASDKQSNGRVL